MPVDPGGERSTDSMPNAKRRCNGDARAHPSFLLTGQFLQEILAYGADGILHYPRLHVLRMSHADLVARRSIRLRR